MYFIGQLEAEVINCTTGKDELGKPSRISKQGLFRRFYNLLGKLNTIEDADKNQCRHYLDAKSSVQNYSVSRNIFVIYQCELRSSLFRSIFSTTACQASVEGSFRKGTSRQLG